MPQFDDETNTYNTNSSGGINAADDAAKEEARRHSEEGERLRGEGKTGDAIIQFKKAITKDPSKAQYYYFIAKSYQVLAKTEGATGFYVLGMDNLRKALQLSPDTEMFHDAKLDLAIKAGGVEELLKEYKELSENNPENEFYKRYLKKISVTNMIAISDVKSASDSDRNIFIKILLDYVFPFAGIILSMAGIMIRKYLDEGSKVYGFSGFMLTTGVVFLVIYAGIKVFSIVNMKKS